MQYEAFVKLTKDLRDATKVLTPGEVRYLVDFYYQIQEYRKRAANQLRASDESDEPNELIGWMHGNLRSFENNIKSAMDAYSDTEIAGKWAKTIVGIGPVIAAGLLAHIDVDKAKTAGACWRFGGIDPTVEWKKGEKRPWNARLKVIYWKIGQSFVKVSGREKDIYGKVYLERKEYEWKRNLRGEYSGQAMAKLEKFNIGESTDAHKWYSGQVDPAELAGKWNPGMGTPKAVDKVKAPNEMSINGEGIPMLPPAHIQQRAERKATALFIAHFHHVLYESKLGEKPPNPYIIEHGGHTHFIAPPNWPME